MEIVNGSPGKVWVDLDCNDNSTFRTAYVGQLVKPTVGPAAYSAGNGVIAAAVASGAYDGTGEQYIMGLVLGNNLYEPAHSTTSNSNAITSVDSHLDTVQRRFAEGHTVAVGDKGAKVEIGIITPNTILKSKIYNSTIGTALTLLTVTTGSTNGTGFTSNATQHAVVAGFATVAGLSGANAGIYRQTYDASTTVRTVNNRFPHDIAIGDTFVSVPLVKSFSKMQVNSTALYIDGAADVTTNCFGIIVYDMWLEDRANAYCTFSFLPMHCGVFFRATS